MSVVCFSENTTCGVDTCQNGGTCLTIVGGGFMCQCAGGYTGKVCAGKCRPVPQSAAVFSSFPGTTSNCLVLENKIHMQRMDKYML